MTMRHQCNRSALALALVLVSLLLLACRPTLTAGPLPAPTATVAAATAAPVEDPLAESVLGNAEGLGGRPESLAGNGTPEQPSPSPSPTFTVTRPPTSVSTATSTPTRTPTPSPTPILTPTPVADSFVYGQSSGGRDLMAWRFGGGPQVVALVGGVHGGLEWNTTELVEALRDYLLADLGLLPDGVRLLLIPVANPDGAAAGVGLTGRVNARGVDLSRNWGLAWREVALWGGRTVDPGPAPFSEPETAALRDLFVKEGVQTAAFVHSFEARCLHGGVFPGPGAASASLAAAMAAATGYPISPAGADYPVGGRPAEWLAAQGGAAVDVHLPDRFQLNWEANVVGLEALLQWALTPQVSASVLTAEGTLPPPWTASSPLYGDVATGYPLTLEAKRFTLHYQPGAPADGDTDYLVAATERALAYVNERLGVSPSWHFDLYVAGTPFAYPGETSRGYTLAYGRRVFVRYDGTGPLVEFEGVLAHELTHLTALNEFQPASSVMLSEGLAVFVQWPLLEAAGWLKLDQVCAAMQSAGVLPTALYLVSDKAGYDGYVDQDNYMASGCFVAFLVEHWGMEGMAKLYHLADWQDVTGQTLADLDRLWAKDTASCTDEIGVDAVVLVELMAEMGRGYAYQARHLEEVQGQPAGWALDGLRVTWRMGRFDKACAYAGEFRALMVGP